MTATLLLGDACTVCAGPVLSGQQVVVLALWDAFRPGWMRREKVLHAGCVVVQARLHEAAPLLGSVT